VGKITPTNNPKGTWRRVGERIIGEGIWSGY